MQTGDRLHWWQTRAFVAAMTLAACLPLLWPDIPPLVDLPGHIGRYRVQLDIGDHPHLATWYDFRWQMIGNLGLDLLIEPMARLFGLEFGVKLIILAIPALTVAGLLWIAREVHGRIPATALFALPLAYSYPFQFGFVNFALAMAIALNLFALWLRLARLGRLRLRAALFVPASCLLWLCHTFGWGVLGVLAFSAELIRQHDIARHERGLVRRWITPAMHAGLGCLPLALPMALMILWRSGDHVTGKTGDWFNWRGKFSYMTMILRDRWMAWDIASTAILYFILFRGVRNERIEYSRNLLLSALFLLSVYFLLPRVVFGSAYADMRLVPFAVAIALIALRPRRGLSSRGSTTLAVMGLAFCLLRLGGTTISYWLYDRDYDRTLAVTRVLPQAARVVTFIGRRCPDYWTYSRLEHIPAMLLSRKLAYANDQWSMAGAQLLTARYTIAGSFAHDPSQVVTDRQCPRQTWRTIDAALTRFPRAAFDYVFLVQPPPFQPASLRGLTPIWQNGTNMLYRVDRALPYDVRRNGVSSAR